ncbi:hypothetical protein JX265_009766 [Neoarthrinium moseri]|uniref:Uncharacterized protein n=1 Tax=Neoarthrinium moseri TaxID=1658444 RepID=A0A9P9WFL9_9PEZI|nr:hypothetical protein JX265_009766 [Neoarthrinium moseri]
MSFKTVFVALFATLTIAAPATNVDASLEARNDAVNVVEKRFEPGWCTFHQHDDWSNGLDTNPTTKIQLNFFDGKKNQFYTFPQTNVRGQIPYHIKPDGFSDPITLSGGPDGGWKYEYKGDVWTTSDKNRCSAGKRADPGSKGNHGRNTQDYDCGFTC